MNTAGRNEDERDGVKPGLDNEQVSTDNAVPVEGTDHAEDDDTGDDDDGDGDDSDDGDDGDGGDGE